MGIHFSTLIDEIILSAPWGAKFGISYIVSNMFKNKNKKQKNKNNDNKKK